MAAAGGFRLLLPEFVPEAELLPFLRRCLSFHFLQSSRRSEFAQPKLALDARNVPRGTFAWCIFFTLLLLETKLHLKRTTRNSFQHHWERRLPAGPLGIPYEINRQVQSRARPPPVRTKGAALYSPPARLEWPITGLRGSVFLPIGLGHTRTIYISFTFHPVVSGHFPVESGFHPDLYT